MKSIQTYIISIFFTAMLEMSASAALPRLGSNRIVTPKPTSATKMTEGCAKAIEEKINEVYNGFSDKNDKDTALILGDALEHTPYGKFLATRILSRVEEDLDSIEFRKKAEEAYNEVQLHPLLDFASKLILDRNGEIRGVEFNDASQLILFVKAGGRELLRKLRMDSISLIRNDAMWRYETLLGAFAVLQTMAEAGELKRLEIAGVYSSAEVVMSRDDNTSLLRRFPKLFSNLEHLGLDSIALEIPSDVDLSNLRSLEFTNVSFGRDISGLEREMPKLEELHMTFANMDSLPSDLDFPLFDADRVPGLKKLYIQDAPQWFLEYRQDLLELSQRFKGTLTHLALQGLSDLDTARDIADGLPNLAHFSFNGGANNYPGTWLPQATEVVRSFRSPKLRVVAIHFEEPSKDENIPVEREGLPPIHLVNWSKVSW